MRKEGAASMSSTASTYFCVHVGGTSSPGLISPATYIKLIKTVNPDQSSHLGETKDEQ